MSHHTSGLLSKVDAESCMEVAQRYYRFAEAADCKAVRQALEETARACMRAASEATQRLPAR